MHPAGRERFDGGRDRFRAMLSRVFGDAENPLQWAFTLGRVAGIRVRIHVIFVIYAVAQLLFATIAKDSIGLPFTAITISLLFVIVLLHEFGHCFACRWVGGEADDILMWPLGGLASVMPPDTPKGHFVTTAGGPAVNVLLLPFLVGAMFATGIGDRVLFNPLDLGLALGGLSWGETVLFLAHAVNLFILVFNVVVPMFPLDGGRLLHAGLWARMDKRQATEIVLTVGLVCAVGLGIFGLVANETLLLGIAIFGGLTCYLERRTLRAADEIASPWAASAQWREEDDRPRVRGPSKKELKRRAEESQEQEELDRVLAKIAASGMDSLTRAERKTLDRATKKRREG
ncbi:MAG: hypothetical protein KF684_02120 [Phycisphaeraceae bacterium]|nr:hypothetical protein [Phycisphaeraceae bacterium]